MFGARRSRASGIYLAGGELHIVELEQDGEAVALRGLVREELDAEFALEQLESDPLCEELVERLRQARDEQGMRFERTVIGLEHRAVYLKRRPLIQGGEKARREHLRWEAEQFLPGRLDEYGLDFLLTRECGFVVAVRRPLLDFYLEVCAESKVKNPLFDVAPFALCNALEAVDQGDAEEATMALELGAAGAGIVLLRAGELCAVEHCEWAAGAGEDARLEVLVEGVERLLESAAGDQRPPRWRLAGAAKQTGAALADRLRMRMEPLDPFRGLDFSLLDEDDAALAAAGEVFAVAGGLAWRGLGEDP